MLSLRDLSYIRFAGTPSETAVLRNITLDIEPGKCTGVAGRSGSGKSTLVQHLNGLLEPTAGAVSLNGIEVTARNRGELRRRVGMVFQFPEQQLFEETVYREIAFGLSQHGMARAAIDQRIRETLQVVGLEEDLLEKSPFRLSGGQRRRVAIAAILARRPDILILDEPAAGLDPRGRRETLDSIARLQRELCFTLLLVSSSLEDIARLADRMVILKDGAVALQGETREVLRNAEALEKAGVPLPPVTRLMMKLKRSIPELNDCVLTAEEARDELKRVLAKQHGGMGSGC